MGFDAPDFCLDYPKIGALMFATISHTEDEVWVQMTKHEARMLVKLRDSVRGTLRPQTIEAETKWLPNCIGALRNLTDVLRPLDPSFDDTPE